MTNTETTIIQTRTIKQWWTEIHKLLRSWDDDIIAGAFRVALSKTQCIPSVQYWDLPMWQHVREQLLATIRADDAANQTTFTDFITFFGLHTGRLFDEQGLARAYIAAVGLAGFVYWCAEYHARLDNHGSDHGVSRPTTAGDLPVQPMQRPDGGSGQLAAAVPTDAHSIFDEPDDSNSAVGFREVPVTTSGRPTNAPGEAIRRSADDADPTTQQLSSEASTDDAPTVESSVKRSNTQVDDVVRGGSRTHRRRRKH